MKFSQRLGITPIEKPLQIESIDKELLNSLWGIYKTQILDKINSIYHQSDKKPFAIWLWFNYFKWDIDTIRYDFDDSIYKIKSFFFKCEWYQVFELIEESIYADESTTKKVDKYLYFDTINKILEREFSAYRFINGIIAPISNELEVKEIETSIQNTKHLTALSGCNSHLTEALRILSDKKTPDYRNSIKESISAIESLCKVISNKNSDTLGSALTTVKDKVGLHNALEKGFKQIYGYTSDAHGIRHGLMEEPNCDFDDAKYMLVSSSAFINYLIAKANKAGISFI